MDNITKSEIMKAINYLKQFSNFREDDAHFLDLMEAQYGKKVREEYELILDELMK